LKENEKWKQYRNVKMEWIQHHNPDLVITDAAGKELERIDLNGKTGAQVEQIMKQKRFKKGVQLGD
jgi:hypothetical protein